MKSRKAVMHRAGMWVKIKRYTHQQDITRRLQLVFSSLFLFFSLLRWFFFILFLDFFLFFSEAKRNGGNYLLTNLLSSASQFITQSRIAREMLLFFSPSSLAKLYARHNRPQTRVNAFSHSFARRKRVFGFTFSSLGRWDFEMASVHPLRGSHYVIGWIRLGTWPSRIFLTSSVPAGRDGEKSLAQLRRWPFWLRDNGPRPLGAFYFRNWDHRRRITFVVAEVANFAINVLVWYRQKRSGSGGRTDVSVEPAKLVDRRSKNYSSAALFPKLFVALHRNRHPSRRSY